MKNKKIISAYMTIEVSLLFPIIIMILVILIYIIFYSYNQTIAFQNDAITSLYGKSFCYEEMEKELLANQMYITLKTLNKKQYLAVDKLEQTIYVDGKKINVSQKGTMCIPFINAEMNKQIIFEESVTLNEKDPIFYIRQIRKVN